jgi:hypothetical protein
MQGLDLAAHDNKNILQYIVGMSRPDHARNVAPKRVMNAAEQVFESVAVIALCPQHPLRFLSRGSHTLLYLVRGSIYKKSSERA